MTIGDGKRGARDYFWFALALIVVLIGSASRASAADAAASDPSSPVAQADGVHDPRHAPRSGGEGFRHLALEIGIDQAVQVHHVIQGLHLD
jgi:Spy/CpxP family protein refolding chaperone